MITDIKFIDYICGISAFYINFIIVININTYYKFINQSY